MEQQLSRAVLTDGAAVDVVLVMPPEPGWADRVDDFLKHKGMPWQMHWQAAFEGACDELETRFYLLVVDGRPISSIMTLETGGVGILGHVFTKPQWRRKGAASILMRAVCEDFAEREGVVLYLYTGYQGMPWRLYGKFGFQGFVPNVGLMRWVRQPGRLEAMFGAEGLTARPMKWRDWPLLECLFLQAGDDQVKNMGLKRFGVCDMEGAFLTLQERMRGTASIRGAVLVNAGGMTVGFGSCVPLDEQASGYMLVDLFARRGAESALGGLLEVMDVPGGTPLLAVIDEPAAARRAALEAAGFALAGCLPGALKAQAGDRNVLLMVRPG